MFPHFSVTAIQTLPFWSSHPHGPPPMHRPPQHLATRDTSRNSFPFFVLGCSHTFQSRRSRRCHFGHLIPMDPHPCIDHPSTSPRATRREIHFHFLFSDVPTLFSHGDPDAAILVISSPWTPTHA